MYKLLSILCSMYFWERRRCCIIKILRMNGNPFLNQTLLLTIPFYFRTSLCYFYYDSYNRALWLPLVALQNSFYRQRLSPPNLTWSIGSSLSWESRLVLNYTGHILLPRLALVLLLEHTKKMELKHISLAQTLDVLWGESSSFGMGNWGRATNTLSDYSPKVTWWEQAAVTVTPCEDWDAQVLAKLRKFF